jgi:membrane associated rhomboid family serine protease
MALTITIIIIIITCLISITAFSSPKVMNDLIFYPARMKGGKEMYRLITHGFIHADFIHLGVNMLTLYFFGTVAETKIFSKAEYIILYITATAAASVFDLFKQRDNYNYRSLGASGAVSAVLFSTIILDPWVSGVCLYGALCLPNIVFGILYIIYSAYMSKKGRDNVGHNAHLWGAVYGFIFTAIARPDLLKNFLERLMHPSFG